MGRRKSERLSLAHDLDGSLTVDEALADLWSFADFIDRQKADGWELNCPVAREEGFLSREDPDDVERHEDCTPAAAPPFLPDELLELRLGPILNGAASMDEAAAFVRLAARWLEHRVAAGYVLAEPVRDDTLRLVRPPRAPSIGSAA